MKSERDKMLHAFAVAYRCYLWAEGDDEVLAALLHDRVEDCDMELSDIESAYGPVVAALVHTLTRGPDETYRAYIERVSDDPVASRIKCHDIRANLERNGGPNESLRERYRWALWYLSMREESES